MLKALLKESIEETRNKNINEAKESDINPSLNWLLEKIKKSLKFKSHMIFITFAL